MKARKLPSGNWNVQLYLGEANGKKKFKSFTAPTRREAESLAASYEIKKDEYHGTVEEAIESYINNRTATLSPATIRSYRTMQRNDFEAINGKKVEEITSEDIQRFINELSKTKSPKSVKNVYALLKASITALNPNRAINVRLPQKNVIERHIPSTEDIKNILDESDAELSLAIMLASIGTMRIGEICALEYSDIQGNMIHVHRDMIPNENQEYVNKDIPKNTASDRYITFPAQIIEQIGKGNGLIFHSTPRAISQRYAKICKRLGMKSTRFHDLRHYAASSMHASGVPDQYIMARGGWSTDTTLKSVYRNILEDERNRFEKEINDSFSAKFLH